MPKLLSEGIGKFSGAGGLTPDADENGVNGGGRFALIPAGATPAGPSPVTPVTGGGCSGVTVGGA